MGGTMRLGAQKCKLVKSSLAHALYKKNIITERHRHRYEVNNNYINKFNDTDLLFSGYSGNKDSDGDIRTQKSSMVLSKSVSS